jgi:hypothetical protein
MKDVNREDRGLKFRFLLLTLLSSPSSSRHLADIFILKKVLALVVVKLPSLDRFQLVNDGSDPFL